MVFFNVRLVPLLFLIFQLSAVFSPSEGKKQNQFDLNDHLLDHSRYNPDIIPICSQDDRVTVKIGMALRDIVEVNEKLQMVRVKVWVRPVLNFCPLTTRRKGEN